MIHTAFGFDGSVRIKADLNHNNFDRGLSAMQHQVDKFGSTLKKLAGTVALAFGTAAIINFGKESLMLASDIEEVQNVIDVTFGRGAKQIEEFAKSAAEAYGLSELSAKQYTGTMGAMLKSSGVVTGAAQEMSLALTGLAGGLASFYNLKTDEAFEKIRSGISGETEPLKQLGINMSVANLEAYALTQGITKSYGAMSQAEQVLLRYNYLLSVTGDAQGDFARTSGSLANQVRIMSLNFDQLRIALGNALMPIAQAVLPGINAIISALTKLAHVFAKVTALLFGKSTQVKATTGVESSAGAAADATDKLAESTEGMGEASKKAEEDMKGAQAGFDELNILAGKAASGMDDAAGGVDLGGTGDFEIPEFEADAGNFEEFEKEFESLGELFVDTLDKMLAAIPSFRDALLDFADNFNEFNQKLHDAFTFPGVKERVEELGRELAEAFNDLVNAINWELWGRTLGAGLNLGLQFLTEFLYTFDWINLGNKLAEFINGIVYEIDWYDFGRLLWAKFKLALETFAGFIIGLDMPSLAQAASNIIIGFFDSIQETIAKIDWAEIGKQIAEFLNNIDWAGIISSISGAIKEMIPAALDLIGGFIQNADTGTLIAASLFFGSKLLSALFSKVVSPIAKQIGSDLIKQIAESIMKGNIGSILPSIGKILAPLGSAITKIAPLIGKISAVAGGAFLAISNFLDMLSNGFSWVKEILMLLGIAIAAVGAVILGVPATVAAVVAAIVAAVATLVVVIKEYWEEIKQAFIGAWNAIKDAWNAAGEWFNEHVIQPVAEFFSNLWEDITEAASNAWDSIQNIWNIASSWFNENIVEPLKQFFSEMWENIQQLASDAWDGIVSIWQAVSGWFNDNIIEPVKKLFSEMWENVQQWASDAWDKIVSVWDSVSEWFKTKIVDPVGKFFSDMWDGIKNAAADAWNNIKSSVTNFWSDVQSWWNTNVAKYFSLEYWTSLGSRMVSGLLEGLKGIFSGISKWASDVWDSITGVFSSNNAKSSVRNSARSSSGSSLRMIPSGIEAYSAMRPLPKLANGAVIPPNQQFAAILGDQRSGMNIEAPLSTIEQALQNVFNRNGGMGGTTDVNITFNGSLAELARILQPAITVETKRIGTRLVEAYR